MINSRVIFLSLLKMSLPSIQFKLFRTLLSNAKAAQKAVQQSNKRLHTFPEPLILPPSAPRKINGSIIWLHGNHLNHKAFQELWFLSLKPKYFRLVLPLAPEREIDGKKINSWYNIPVPHSSRKFGQNPQEDEEGIRKSEEYIKQLIENESKIVPTNKITLGGFGEGGALALYTGLRHHSELGGIISASGYCLFDNKFSMNETNKNTEILCLHGAKDEVVPESLAREGYEQLKMRGVTQLNYHVEPEAQHQITDTQKAAISTFFGVG